MKHHKKGFTLVELSIVLVIIGLLIGGILSAQSMISTARVGKYIRQMQQSQIVVENFYQNFNQLPGDSINFIPPGNGNGTWDNNVTCTGVYLMYETLQIWAHLKQASMVQDNYVPYQPVSCGGTHANYTGSDPLIKISLPEFSSSPKHALSMGGNYDVITFYSSLKSQESFALDSKLDDGNVNTGNYMSITTSALCTLSDDECMMYYWSKGGNTLPDASNLLP